MLETTTDPLALDVYRGVSELRDLSDDTTWRDTYEAGLSDALDLCGSNWLIHGRVNREVPPILVLSHPNFLSAFGTAVQGISLNSFALIQLSKLARSSPLVVIASGSNASSS